uniref:Reverse transcriptase zinc-binding domain-containing protein n=1 Tax=Arundo donax TaxID=35708 RepID=A0A0A8Z8E5_ARUDO
MLSSSSLSPYSLAIAGPKPSLLQAVAAATGALAPPPSGISDMACDHVWFGLAKKGVIWRVGDGSKIKIWRHSWIPRPVFLKLAGRRRPCRLRWVSQLIDENARSWNESMLRRFFHSHDVVEILKIKLPWRQRDDFVAWHFEKSGFFSVRSASVLVSSYAILTKEDRQQAIVRMAQDRFGRNFGPYRHCQR